MNKSITKLSFFDDYRTILLLVNKQEIDLRIFKKKSKVENLEFKKEFHITIIGFSVGEEIANLKIDFKKVKSIAEKYNWNYDFNDNYYYIEKELYENNSKEKRRSVVQLVELPDLEFFYKDLNNEFSCHFDVPFPHLTLLTTSTDISNVQRGIGIDSEREFLDLNPKKINIIYDI